MSPCQKLVKMKSTLKATYRSGSGDSVIKIVIPTELLTQDDPDDVRDKHLADFVRSLQFGPHELFEVKSVGTDEVESVFIETIGPITKDMIPYTLEHYLLNRYVPYDTLVAIQSAKNDPASYEYSKSFPGRDTYFLITGLFDKLEGRSKE